MIRVLLVDDHAVIREGLAAVLGCEPDIEVVGAAPTAEDALEMVGLLHPDVVVMDVRLPGIDGIEATTEVLNVHPDARVLMITSAPHPGTVRQAFGAGAHGFIAKESDPTVVREAVRAVAGGETFVDERVPSVSTPTEQARLVDHPVALTPREIRVVELLPKGLSNRQIGDVLGLSANTVKSHLYHVMQKLGIHDRAELAALVTREGLASPEEAV